MLLGEPLDDLSKYKESLGEQSYRLDDLANTILKKTFYISAAFFSVQNKKLRRQRKEGWFRLTIQIWWSTKRRCYPKCCYQYVSAQGKSVIDLDYNNNL
jgi:hypothetical protein